MTDRYVRLRELAWELSGRPEPWAVEVSGDHIIMTMSRAKRAVLIVARTARQ